MSYYLTHPIHIVEYDAQWPLFYEQEKDRLQASIGPLLLAIEHMGSTSVPGLPSKPIIDILAGVRNLEDINAYVFALQAMGYEDAQINPVFHRRLFCKGGYNEGSHHLCFVVYGSEGWLLPLRFRDYLREHSDARIEYGELKQQLARKYEHDLDGYSVDKGPFVEAILAVTGGRS